VKECAKKKFGVGFRGGFSLFLSFGGSKRKKKIEKCNSMFRKVMPKNYAAIKSSYNHKHNVTPAKPLFHPR
jgi:hypothetical protein